MCDIYIFIYQKSFNDYLKYFITTLFIDNIPKMSIIHLDILTHQMMMMKKVTTQTKSAAKKPAINRLIGSIEFSSSGIKTASSCPSSIIVGFSSLAIATSSMSISVVAMTVPSSEAWARVEEKVALPLEQEEVELRNFALSTGHLQ